ncbi:MAG: BamA/TamA family outer membrane protein, partial [bacterium]|nr:BamA/TamA family outer membrane protein [bacterium]
KPLAQTTPDELKRQVIKALQPYGYFKAQVDVQIFNNNNASIAIKPGPQTYISSLQVQLRGEGAENPILKKTINELPLTIGAPLLTRKYNKAKQSITNTAENLGYLHGAYITAEILVDEHNNTAQITLIFNTGPLFYFGQVQFDPTNINPDLLHRFIPFKAGQPYSTDLILKLNNHLADSGYFSSVLVKPNITDAQTVPIAVHLQPVSKYSYSLGAGYGTDTGIRGRAGLHIVPLNRKGHKFNALAQGSFNQNALQAQYVVPGTNPVTDQYTVTGNFSNLNYDAGYSNAYLLSLAQQHNLDNYKRALSINALYERFNYTQQPNTDQFMLYPKASFTFRNSLNKLFSPTGYNLTLNALGASQLLLSKTSFGQVSLDAKGAYMIDPWRLRLYGHAIQGFTAINDINKLPLSLALLLGGADNLKAYGFNSIGPGKLISYGGIELQKETVKNWYLIGFYDAGDVYDPSIKGIQFDAGAALMWVSPIGPIKLGLAQAIDSHFQRTSNTPRLVISMGPDL